MSRDEVAAKVGFCSPPAWFNHFVALTLQRVVKYTLKSLLRVPDSRNASIYCLYFMQTSNNQRYGSRCEHLYPSQATLTRYHGTIVNWLQTVLYMSGLQTVRKRQKCRCPEANALTDRPIQSTYISRYGPAEKLIISSYTVHVQNLAELKYLN